MPFFSQLGQFGGVGQSFQAVGSSYGVPYAQVRERHDIGPLQGKHEKHLRRPDPHASDLRKKRDDLFIRQTVEFTKVNFAPVNPLGQIRERGDFLPRETAHA